jgi:hypothetical protein
MSDVEAGLVHRVEHVRPGEVDPYQADLVRILKVGPPRGRCHVLGIGPGRDRRENAY